MSRDGTRSIFHRALAGLCISSLLLAGCALVANLSQFDGAIGVEAGTTSGDSMPGPFPEGSASNEASAGSVADANSLPNGADVSSFANGPDASSLPNGRDAASPMDGADPGSLADAAEAGAAVDAPLDGAGDDGAESSVRWCVANATPNTTFCRDFDDGKGYEYGFITFIRQNGTNQPPTITSDDSVSPPSSLMLKTIPVSNSDYENDQLVVHISDHNYVELHFALKLVHYDVNVTDLSLVRIAYDSGQWSTSWDLQNTSAAVFEGFQPTDGGTKGTTIAHPIALPPLDQWLKAVLTVDVTEQTASLWIDGKTVLQTAISAPPLVGSLSVIIGVNYLRGSSTSMTIYYDDVEIITH